MTFGSHCLLCIATAAIATAGHAATPSVPEFAPNPAVSWIALTGKLEPLSAGAGPVQDDPAFPQVTNDEFRATGRQPTQPIADLNNPILQPWAREEVRKYNALARADKALSPGTSCWPMGVPAVFLRRIQPLFFIQAHDKVLMVSQPNHEVRHIYLTDRHSENVKPSWYGESIGHYEGDELVVDTVGMTTKTYIDDFYTPHTDRLHVVEHVRMTDGGNRLEIRLQVEDPGAFTMPWNAIIRFRRVEPGRAENTAATSAVTAARPAGPLLEVNCAENPFSYFGDQSRPIPQATKLDF